MKNKVNNFIFKRHIVRSYGKNFQPPGFLTIEDELKDELLKSGYLVSHISKAEVTQLCATIARANVPLEERIKIQKEIDSGIFDKDEIKVG